jgi:hypothetical protein
MEARQTDMFQQLFACMEQIAKGPINEEKSDKSNVANTSTDDAGDDPYEDMTDPHNRFHLPRSVLRPSGRGSNRGMGDDARPFGRGSNSLPWTRNACPRKAVPARFTRLARGFQLLPKHKTWTNATECRQAERRSRKSRAGDRATNYRLRPKFWRHFSVKATGLNGRRRSPKKGQRAA